MAEQLRGKSIVLETDAVVRRIHVLS